MRRLGCVAIAGLCACAPNASSANAPVDIMAMLYDITGTLGPLQTTLQTVDSVANLTGTAADLVGGSVIIVDPNNAMQANPAGLSNQQLEDAYYADRGSGVAPDLIGRQGVLWPADFHSWNMVTAYWNFEQAYLYFKQVYADDTTLDQLDHTRVLYWADYRNLSISDPTLQDLTDNALYLSVVQAFILAPFANATCDGSSSANAEPGCLVPIPMNTGIIGHEYSHLVFNNKAANGANLPVYFGWDGRPLNMIKALDEGLADFHGYGVTCAAAKNNGAGCSTRFLAPSFGTNAVVDQRDFSKLDKCMTPELRNEITTQDSATFIGNGTHYKLGTLFATALYQAGKKSTKLAQLQTAIVAAYTDESPATPGFSQLFDADATTPENLSLEALSDVILSHIKDNDLKTDVCNELWERLDLQVPSGASTPSPSCPLTSIRGQSNCAPLAPP